MLRWTPFATTGRVEGRDDASGLSGAAQLLLMGPTRVLGPTNMQGGADRAAMPGIELLCTVLPSGEGVRDIASFLFSWKDAVGVPQDVARTAPRLLFGILAASMRVALQPACQATLQTSLQAD